VSTVDMTEQPYPTGYASVNTPLLEWAKTNGVPLRDQGWPEPEDRGHARLSALGTVEYVDDILRPGRIVVVAAEEGTGKSYAVAGELAIRLALAGGDFADTWPVLEMGPVLVLSEMHADDDYLRETLILESLGLARTRLVGGYYRLPLMTAAGGQPALKSEAWREWITAWLRDRGALALIVDTATAASNVDPWGSDIQAIYRGLRNMQEAYRELAIVLVVHLKKPNGRGERRISDVLGEWGRWNDVTILMENDGASLERVKITVRKRVRHERRIVVTKRDGLLVDPHELETGGPKVPMARVLEAIASAPGIDAKALGLALDVSRKTAMRYAAGAEAEGKVCWLRWRYDRDTGQTGTRIPVSGQSRLQGATGTAGHHLYRCPCPCPAPVAKS
jgi:hypothetical protein